MTDAPASSASAASTAGPVLRDIHLPAEPSWWPPAPGWWLLAACVLLALAALAWAWRRHHRARRYQRRILDELERLVRVHREDGDRAAMLGGLHQLLRRVARPHDAAAVRLRGEAWREVLARVPVDSATLAARVRDSAVTVVHAHGLTLEEVHYPDDHDLAAQAQRSRVVRTLEAP